MRSKELIFLTVIFIIFDIFDSRFNSFLIDFYIVTNFTYILLCYLCLRNPQKINAIFGAYIGFLIDLQQNVFFGLHATLFTLSIALINYNYFKLRMFSSLQKAVALSFFTAFFVGFKSILTATMNFQYQVVFLSFFSALIAYFFISSLGKFIMKKTKL